MIACGRPAESAPSAAGSDTPARPARAEPLGAFQARPAPATSEPESLRAQQLSLDFQVALAARLGRESAGPRSCRVTSTAVGGLGSGGCLPVSTSS